MDQLSQYMNIVNSLAMQNNMWSAAQAQKQMDFQRELSSNAHQREVQDLKAAGLNPILSAHGNGASTPNGAQGDTDNSNVAAVAELLREFGSSVAEASAYGYASGSGAGSGVFGMNDGDLNDILDMAADAPIKKRADQAIQLFKEGKIDAGKRVANQVIEDMSNLSATNSTKAMIWFSSLLHTNKRRNITTADKVRESVANTLDSLIDRTSKKIKSWSLKNGSVNPSSGYQMWRRYQETLR